MPRLSPKAARALAIHTKVHGLSQENKKGFARPTQKKTHRLPQVEGPQSPDPITLEIEGTLIGKERARSGRNDNHYTPERTRKAQEDLARIGREAMHGYAPFRGAVEAVVIFIREPPESWSAKKKRMAIDGLVLPTSKPDGDNQVKTLFDGLEGAVYHNDSQITDKIVRKRFGEKARVIATFRSIEPDAKQMRNEDIQV